MTPDTNKIISTLEDVLRYLETNRKCSCTLSHGEKSGICSHCKIGDKVENLRTELKTNL